MKELEEKFGAELKQARWCGADDVAEGGAVDISVDGLRSEELRVIEDVERFEAELNGPCFAQFQIFQESHIEVRHPGP